ncbi:AAA domain-containing protein [Heliorestis acidaminivorans]|uniref:AAA domain-containing protein n=1 Tax=Heliorestis acidaminivorans TaxID=553427 RepID=A0A6I0EZV2_9FIRM|nr:AAA family ATPase [Heliorestis acidaminivorans]KAB2952262.1 AAA domain-containing protein [Heliorestis acidaminivorans]
MRITKWPFDVIGVLASDEYVATKMNGGAVFVNRQNSLQFSVKLISQTPEGFPSNSLYTGYASDIERYGFEEKYFADDYQRIEDLKEFLAEKLFIFRPERRGDYFYIKDVRLVPKPLSYREESTYLWIPFFSQEQHGLNYQDFLQKLTEQESIGFIQALPEVMSTPTFLLWRNEDHSFTIFGEFRRHRHSMQSGFSFQYDVLKKSEFPEEWFEEALEVPGNDTLLFLSSEKYNEIYSLMKASTHICTSVSEKEAPNLSPSLEAPIVDRMLDIQLWEEQLSALETNKEDISEDLFIQNFMQITREQGLLYDWKDLIHFHTAMKTSTLVVLTGMSGTGKSRLVQSYVKALQLTEDQFTMIPVRPAWNDDADLIGSVNFTHKVFQPANSGLIDILLQACKEENKKEKLYIVCFDEMNLARVEHYFSQFLSVLEMDANKRLLRLYNEDLESQLYNAAQYPPTIPISDNVLFVGTVNIDESTYHFSDKVLDRANVIQLNIMPFEDLKKLKEEKSRKSISRKWTLPVYQSFIKEPEDCELTDRELSFLRQFHLQLQRANKNLGIGFRILRQIDKYLKNLPRNPFITRSEAFDRQIVQRILTKVRGPEEQLKSLLGVSLMERQEVVSEPLLGLLDEYKDLSSFQETRQILYQKAKELNIYGYTV